MSTRGDGRRSIQRATPRRGCSSRLELKHEKMRQAGDMGICRAPGCTRPVPLWEWHNGRRACSTTCKCRLEEMAAARPTRPASIGGGA